MVILFSERKNDTEKEIIEILTYHNGNYISDRTIKGDNGAFTVISEYQKTDLQLEKGVVLILGNTKRFKDQKIPTGIVGICEDNNHSAFKLFEKSRIPVISCGMNSKSTLTISSLEDSTMFLSLQRIITDINGNEIEPFEFKIKLKKIYNPFSVMASSAVLLTNGIIPFEF